MATLKKRRGVWYARVRWYFDSIRQEKQIPLKTDSKVTARERLAKVNKVESDIKAGMNFFFPWLHENSSTTLKRFTFSDAKDQWLKHREKSKIRKKTIELNKWSMDLLIEFNGAKKPLVSFTNSDVNCLKDYLYKKGYSETTINIHLRNLKCMMRYFLRIGRIDSVPLIEQVKIDKTDPIYITDQEFGALMELEWLDVFYKRIFLLYRDTGMRLREPFMAKLNDTWLDVPPKSKSHSARSLQLTQGQRSIFVELDDWCRNGYGSHLIDKGHHISKKFKKSLRYINSDESKHFHSLRHTYAVRNLLQGMSIYEVKLMMGHASVTTTEQYTKMNLKRVAHDFPKLVNTNSNTTKFGNGDTNLWDTEHQSMLYVQQLKQIEA